MSSSRLPNYLRSARKRLALSQEEVAFLMGGHGGARVSSYESFSRLPNLKKAIAFEVIYGKPVGDLFAGLRDSIAKDIEVRARVLKHRLSFQGDDARSSKRRNALAAILPASNSIQPEP